MSRPPSTAPSRTEAASVPTATDLERTVRRLARRRELWSPVVRFRPERRWYTLLDVTPDHEAWLLTWLPGQSTGLHDHGPSAGAFAVVAGTLTESTLASAGRDRADRDRGGSDRPAHDRADGDRGAGGSGGRVSRTTFACGRARSFGPDHLHDIANLGPAPAVSIHVYAPALTTMRRYLLDADADLVTTAVERAGVDW